MTKEKKQRFILTLKLQTEQYQEDISKNLYNREFL